MSVPPGPDALIGTWDPQRRLVDHVAGIRGFVSGELILRVVGRGLEWRESAQLQWGQREVPVTRRYLLQETADGWWVYFEDGRPFHPCPPSSLNQTEMGRRVRVSSRR